ncbi:hypothetical protein FN846DRAFT_1005937 [Sphaerosporella brunnea]|uniref:Uncharacterized protein n=1 Tax=Sphaerosporella brunnea TaxID=1250544 RepID=A0A5J5EE49_9PEZI|nr:hypothetical protein FN846DRAFT_1005937 [Sphaerosporella brunnea]
MSGLRSLLSIVLRLHEAISCIGAQKRSRNASAEENGKSKRISPSPPPTDWVLQNWSVDTCFSLAGDHNAFMLYRSARVGKWTQHGTRGFLSSRRLLPPFPLQPLRREAVQAAIQEPSEDATATTTVTTTRPLFVTARFHWRILLLVIVVINSYLFTTQSELRLPHNRERMVVNKAYHGHAQDTPIMYSLRR